LEFISRRTYRRWLRQAMELELLRPWGSGYYQLVARGRVYKRLGLRCDRRKAWLPEVGVLFRPGWKAAVYDAFMATTRGRPISRKTIERLTTKPPTTQRRYQKRAGVMARRNVLLFDIPANRDWIRYQQLEEGRYFEETAGMLAKPLPNSYASRRAVCGARGQALKFARGTFLQGGGEANFRARYFKSRRAAVSAARRGVSNAIYFTVYHGNRGERIWRAADPLQFL